MYGVYLFSFKKTHVDYSDTLPMAKILCIYFDIPDTYCLLFPSSTCAQPAVGIVQTSLIPLNQSKAAMSFTKCDEN